MVSLAISLTLGLLPGGGGCGNAGVGGNGDSFWDLSPPDPPPIDCPFSPPPVDISPWSKSEIWDDGRAEIATYSAVPGIGDDFEATMITVKESFAIEQAVKAEPPYDNREVIDVLKVNWLQTIPFGTTASQWLTSVFVRRDNPFQLLKATHSSQNWDGNYYRKLAIDKGEVLDEWHSYIDGEAQGEESYSEGPFVTPEQLVVALRAIEPAESLQFKIRISRPLRSARYLEFQTSAADVTFELVDTPAAIDSSEKTWSVEKAWKINVTGDDFEWRYWYADSQDRHLLKLEGPDLQLQLKNIERRSYWLPESDP